MILTSALAVFLITWSSLFLVDYTLRLTNCVSYIAFAEKYGLEISPFQLRIYASRREQYDAETIRNVGPGHAIRRTLGALWFGLGAIVSVISLVVITIYLGNLFVSDLSTLAAHRPQVASFRSGIPTESVKHVPSAPEADTVAVDTDMLPQSPHEYDVLEGDRSENGNGLVPIIPGVNLPWHHIPVFMAVLIVAAVVHELGHSAAADTNGVRVNGFGIFVFALYPGAFTDIEPTSLKRAPPFRRLMIFGGGIWHNILLAGFAYLLYASTPSLLFPLYTQGQGVTVTDVDSRSGLAGPAGLSAGDIVTAIDACPVLHAADWRNCVLKLSRETNGRCVSRSLVHSAKTDRTSVSHDEVQCCDDFTNASHAHICFESHFEVVTVQAASKAPRLERVLKFGAVEEKPAEVVQKRTEYSRQFSCLSAQYVTEQPVCNTSSNGCEQFNPLDPKICVFAALYNGTQLARITLRHQSRPVLYVGDLSELVSFVSIHELVARWDWIPFGFADFAELLPKYLFTLSVALAALNAVPCYALDGQYIVITMINWGASCLAKRRREQIISLILLLGTFLLAANIIIGFVKFLFI